MHVIIAFELYNNVVWVANNLKQNNLVYINKKYNKTSHKVKKIYIHKKSDIF